MHVSSRFAFFQFEISEDILCLITFPVLCEWMPSLSRAKPISPELSCFCPQPAGHHARGCLHLSMSQSVSAGHLPPIMGWPVVVHTDIDNGSYQVRAFVSWYHHSPMPMYQTHYCCIDFTLICIQIVHNKHCTSALTSHLSCCLSLNWIRRKYHEENKKYIK